MIKELFLKPRKMFARLVDVSCKGVLRVEKSERFYDEREIDGVKKRVIVKTIIICRELGIKTTIERYNEEEVSKK